MSTEPLARRALTADQLTKLAPIVEAARDYAASSLAERTQTVYAKQWSYFVAWCHEHGLSALPAAPKTVGLYIAARAKSGRKVASIAQALAAIGQAHQLAGHGAPHKHAAVRATMKGIRRELGTAPRQKAPLLAAQLRELVKTLPSTTMGARDRALLLLGFAGAFRRSELVALTVADVAFHSEGLTVTLRRSKTDQTGRGRPVGVPYGSTSGSCPVRSLQRWLEISAIAEGPLFRSINRHGQIGAAPLGAQDVARIVKRTAEAAGLESQTLAAHSLRAGLATSAARAGKAAHMIMKTTGHRSVAMVHRYIRDAELFVDNPAAGLL